MLIVFLVASISGCARQDGSSKYQINIFYKDKVVKSFTPEELQKIPKSKIQVEGKLEEGPVLLDVLKKADIQDFSMIKIKGIAGDEIVLNRTDIDESVILDRANRGTYKLAAKNIDKSKWVKDIIEIRVE
jgi:hypothetical protein